MLFVLPSLGYGLYLYATTGSPILLIMSGLTVIVWSLVRSQRDHDLKAEVTVQSGRVFLGDKRLSPLPWLWGRQVRNVVYQAIAQTRAETEAEVRFLPGELLDLSNRELFRVKLDERNPHLIIIGRSGSGKTQLLKWLLQSAPDFRVIDFKGGVDFPELQRSQLFTQDDQAEAMAWIEREIRDREAQRSQKLVWIVVDELGEALRESKLNPVLESVAAKGRGLGIHLVLVNQTMTAIPRTIWANCANRIVLQADPVDRVQLGFSASSPDQAPQQIRGDFLGTRSCQFEFPAPRASSRLLQAGAAGLLPSDQTRPGHRSVEALTEPLHPHDHLLGRRVQPYTWPD